MTVRRSLRLTNNNNKENDVSTLAARRTASLNATATNLKRSRGEDVVDNETTRDINAARNEVTGKRTRTSEVRRSILILILLLL